MARVDSFPCDMIYVETGGLLLYRYLCESWYSGAVLMSSHVEG